jgi:hypothetical protein
MGLQDFSMPATIDESKALFLVRLGFGEHGAIQVKVEKGPNRIDQIMTAEALEATGIGKLTEGELTNLSSWLDPDKTVAPGPISH